MSDAPTAAGTTRAAGAGWGTNATLAVCVAALVPVAALTALELNGSMPYDPTLGLPDPGAVTRFGLPIARGLRDLTATLTIGALVMLAFVLPPAARDRRFEISGLRGRTLTLVTVTGLVWFWSSCAVLALTFSDIAGEGVGTRRVRQQLLYFATEFELGQLLFASTLLVAGVTLISLFTRSITGVGILVALAVMALWPLALGGHASGSTNHDLGTNALFLHTLAVSVWLGGLAVLALVHKNLGAALPVVARRYSRLAGVCFAAVLVSGVASALLRVSSWSELTTTGYGSLVMLKTFALALLGVAGWQQRRRVLPRLTTLSSSHREFGRLVLVELALMATTVGLAVALSRTAPPDRTAEPLTAAESLLGFPLPPELTAARWFTAWEVDSLWTPLAVAGIVGYLFGVRRLRRRGDRWSTGRTLAWITGCLMLLWATSSAPGAYAEVLFSMHMIQHMTVATGAPVFLVLGAPVTLALRAVRGRTDGSMGPREWLLLVVHSRVATFLGNPVVAAALFIASLVVFYNSGLLENSLRGHTMHLLMVGHFLVTGYLFANGIVGIDPGPKRPSYPFRMLIVMATFGFHSLFSVSLMSSSRILAEDWFDSLGRTWGRSLVDDQYLGASLGWALGDYPLALLTGALVWSWVKADSREAAGHDRRAERDGHRELASYNDYLKSLADREDGHR